MVVFTTSEETLFSEFNTEEMVYRDDRLSIVFETEEMMEETLILLRFNCPDTDCDYIAKGWADLKLHVRANHNKLMWCAIVDVFALNPLRTNNVIFTVIFVYD